MARNKAAKTTTIAFRIQPEQLAKLDAECTRLGVSRGELTRAIVALYFDAQPQELLQDIRKVTSRLSVIHRNQARILVSLLNLVGGMSLDEAKNVARMDLLT